jgi:hypothetical protein
MRGACFSLQYDRRLVMPWLLNNAIMCGLLFLIAVGGAITCFIVTASQLRDDVTTVTYGFIILVPGAFVVGNTGHILHDLRVETRLLLQRILCGLLYHAVSSYSVY